MGNIKFISLNPKSNYMSTQMNIPSVDWVNTLKVVLENINTPQMSSIISKVPVEMNQYLDYWIFDENGKKRKNPNPTPNHYYENGIINHSRKYKILTGFDYEDSVNGRRLKEGKPTDFKVKENWFEVISKGLVIDKSTRSKYYFRYQFQLDSTLEQEFIYQNDLIGRELFKDFEKKKSEYENQDLDNPCRFQVCNLNHILQLTIDGTRYNRI